MKTIIQPSEKTKLIEQQQLKDLYTGDYLNDEMNDNFKIISDIFFHGNNSRCKSFNVGTGLFTSITDILANFVGNPMNDLKLDINPYVKDYVSVGKSVFGLKRHADGSLKGRYEIYYIPAENHVVSDGTSKVFTTYTQIEGQKLNKVYYILKQEFLKGKITNTLYRKESVINDGGQEVPLTTLKETEHLLPEVATGLGYPSIFYVEVTDLPGVQSELDRVKPLIYSLDRKAVMFETQFLKEVDQYKVFENIDLTPYVSSDGTLDTNAMGKIFENKNGQGSDIKFISNKNELISEAIEYEQTQLRKISAFTGIPSDFLGITSVTAISGTSRALMMGAFIEKIQSYRDIFQDKLMEIIKLLEGQKNKEGEPIKSNFVWDDIINKTDKELIEEVKMAIEAGIISRYTGIQKYLRAKTDKEVMDEIERINKEKILFGDGQDDGGEDKDNADVGKNKRDDSDEDKRDDEK